MAGFLSPQPVVKIEKYFKNPFKTIITSAKTCYSSGGIIGEGQIGQDYFNLAKDLYKAGHHTTIQHASFQFSIANVSRQFIWTFLHSHPFYNSEQVSQRYVSVKSGNYVIPDLKDKSLKIYKDTVNRQFKAYEKLTEIIRPAVESEYFKRFPGRAKNKETYKREILKKSREISRYVLPTAIFSYLYHTVNAVTILRYNKLCSQLDSPTEQRLVVSKMIEELLKIDPQYSEILDEPVDVQETPEFQFFSEIEKNGSDANLFKREFDQSLKGRISKLIDYKSQNEQILARAVREVMALPASKLSDSDSIDYVLNPSLNRLLSQELNLTMNSKLTRALFHPSYTFRKKISHSADSQDQRHRMTPASRPSLTAHLTDRPDYITPTLIRSEDKALKLYSDTMELIWENINTLLKNGTPKEFALYLLPNAVCIRFSESSDLLNLRHKYAMRLCYNAQEEIWRTSLQEVQQIIEVNPLIGKYLLPPCTLRYMTGKRPFCPERGRFCGVKVWKMNISRYERLI